MAPESFLSKPRVLLTGPSGFLGRHLARALAAAGAEVVGAGRSVPNGVFMDLDDPESARAAALASRCDLVLHAAAMAVQGECEKQSERARRINHVSTVALLRDAPRWVFVSTDLVFDGTRPPYDESAEVSPLSVYGRTKAAAEAELLGLGGGPGRGPGLVVRIPLLFGQSPTGDRGATDMIRAAARSGRPATLFTDEYRTPLHVEDAAAALVRLLFAPAARGLVHLPGPERVTRHELGARFIAAAGLPASCIKAGLRRDLPGPPRPEDVSLASVRLREFLAQPFPALGAMLARS